MTYEQSYQKLKRNMQMQMLLHLAEPLLFR